MDNTLRQVRAVATPYEMAAVARTALPTLGAVIRQRVQRPPPDAGDRWTGRHIGDYLRSCRSVIEQEMIRLAGPLDAAQGLWYLRRLARSLMGGVDAEASIRIADLATIAAGLPNRPAARAWPMGDQHYPLDHATVQRLLKLCVYARLLSEVRTIIGHAALDADFMFEDEWPIPRAIVSDDVAQALTLARSRVQAGAYPLLSMGTVIGTARPDLPDHDVSILAVFAAYEPHSSEGPVAPLPWNPQRVVLWNYGMRRVSLAGLPGLAGDPRLAAFVWPSETGAIMLLLRLIVACMETITWERVDSTLHSYGYVVVSREPFVQAVDAVIEREAVNVRHLLPTAPLPTTTGEFFDRLYACHGSLSPPLNGPVLYRVRGQLVIDLYAATQRLQRLLELPQTADAIGRARGDHFQDVVQRVIDASPWRPSDELRQYARRHLEYGGSQVAEIDAIGERDGTLLIANAKSLLYATSTAYAEGENRALRQARDWVERYVAQWIDRRQRLIDHPIGANYDFSSYSTIIGVVCIPQVAYVPLGPTTAEVAPGLRAASTISELAVWLHQGETEGHDQGAP